MAFNKNDYAVYEALNVALKAKPYPPSQRELVAATGLNISGVNDSIRVLEAAGYVERTPGIARSLRITKKLKRKSA